VRRKRKKYQKNLHVNDRSTRCCRIPKWKIPEWKIRKESRKEGTKERRKEWTPRGVAAAMAGASVRAKYSTLPYTFLSGLAGNSDPWLGSIAAVGPGSFSFVTTGKALL
jgi:hypothetical protein